MREFIARAMEKVNERIKKTKRWQAIGLEGLPITWGIVMGICAVIAVVITICFIT